MMAKKIDGVVEAVQYTSLGLIARVRLYERRGPAFSDHILLDRSQLLQRLKDHKNIVTGQRQPALGGTFTTGPALTLIESHGSTFIATGSGAQNRDHLDQVPLF